MNLSVDLIFGLLLGCLLTVGGQKVSQDIQRGSWFSPGCLFFFLLFFILFLGVTVGWSSLWAWFTKAW